MEFKTALHSTACVLNMFTNCAFENCNLLQTTPKAKAKKQKIENVDEQKSEDNTLTAKKRKIKK